MAPPSPAKPAPPTARTRTVHRRPGRRDMSHHDPTQRRISVPSMLRSMSLQPRPSPTPPPPAPDAQGSTGPYTPFTNRGPYVVGNPGPYWLKLEDSEEETGTEEELPAPGRPGATTDGRRRPFADRGPYVVTSTLEVVGAVPDRSPTVSPVSLLSLPKFDLHSEVSLDRFSELEIAGPSGSFAGERHSPSRFQEKLTATPAKDYDTESRFEDIITDTGAQEDDSADRFADPPTNIRNVLCRSGEIRQEYVPTDPSDDPIRPFPTMPRSQSLYMLPTWQDLYPTIQGQVTPTYEERFDFFAGFDGVGRQRTPFSDDADNYSITPEASQTRRSTPVYPLPVVSAVAEVRAIPRMPSNPDFGPIRFERTRTDLSYDDFDDGLPGFRVSVSVPEVPDAPPAEAVEVVVEERLRKPKLKHRIKYLSGRITSAVERMRKTG